MSFKEERRIGFGDAGEKCSTEEEVETMRAFVVVLAMEVMRRE